MNFYTLLKLHKRIKSRRLKLLGLLVASRLGMRYLSIRIDPVLGCNLACKMCMFSSPDFKKKNKGIFKLDEMEKLARVLFPRAFQVVVGCGAEPTLHKNYQDLLRLAVKYKVPDISLVTNGQLLRKEDIQDIINIGIDEIILSAHGVKKDTYESFMTGASYEVFHEVLGNIREIRQKASNNKVPTLRINYTVNADNMEELVEFFDVFGAYNVDILQVRPIMDIGGQYNQQLTEDKIPAYNSIINTLKEESRKHVTRLLANTMDATYQEGNTDTDISELVYTYISPQTANKLELDWGKCSFKDFRKANRWMFHLKRAFLNKGSQGNGLKNSLKYDEV